MRVTTSFYDSQIQCKMETITATAFGNLIQYELEKVTSGNNVKWSQCQVNTMIDRDIVK